MQVHIQKFIPPGQGFLVKVKKLVTQVTFTSAMQQHGSQSFVKKSTSPWTGFNLIAKSGDLSSTTTIDFQRDMTKGLDPTYDAGAFSANNNLSIYSRLINDNGIDFAIQCLPSEEADDLEIPVGLRLSSSKVITFSAEVFGLPSGYKLLLEDRKLGTITNLGNQGSSYDVQVDSTDNGIGRFYLHTRGAVGIQDFNNRKDLSIFVAGDEIVINGNPGDHAIADLFSVTGVKLGTFKLEPADVNRLAVTVGEGFYILRVVGKEVNVTKRLFLK